jgi:hypothetical protein
MSAPLRIKRHPNEIHLGDDTPADASPLKEYVDRLVKLVPAEVLGVYLTGKSEISQRFQATPSGTVLLSERNAWIILTAFCLIAAFLVRMWATSDKRKGVPPDYGAVLIACGAFLVWVYSLGDVFSRVWNIWDPLAANFLVLGWTFLAPILYTSKNTGSS